MFNPPSFLYSGIDQETIQLNNELNRLGGGNTQISNFKLHASINSSLKKDDHQVLWNYATMIGIRDINLPRNSPVTKSMKYYPANSIHTFPFSDDTYQQPSNLFSNIAEDLLQSINDGYSSSLISIGMNNNINKSRLLFGGFGTEVTIESNCIINHILIQLYNQANCDTSAITTIAISSWFIQSDSNKTIDLMVPIVTSNKEPLQFCSVEAPTIDIAYQLLQESRSRAPGCLPISNNLESQKGHYFCRILIHKRLNYNTNGNINDQGSLSYLYLIDLNNMVSVEDKYFKRLNTEDQIVCRANNLQLQTLFKILQEMRTLSMKAQINEYSPIESSLYSLDIKSNHQHINKTSSSNNINFESIMKITSARESKLTSILAPLLQGNMNTSFLINLEDGEAHAHESLNLLKAFHGLSDITSACICIKDISLKSLNLFQYPDVIGPYYSHPEMESNLMNEFHNSDQIDYSTDYENIDFDSILKKDFRENSRANNKKICIDKNLKQIKLQTNRTLDSTTNNNKNNNSNEKNKKRNETKNVDHIMNEFHDLMEELEHINKDNIVSSPLKLSKQAVDTYLSSSSNNNNTTTTTALSNNKQFEFPNIPSVINRLDYNRNDISLPSAYHNNSDRNESEDNSIACDSLQDDNYNDQSNDNYDNQFFYDNVTNTEKKYNIQHSLKDYYSKIKDNNEFHRDDNYIIDEYDPTYFPTYDNINDIGIPYNNQEKFDDVVIEPMKISSKDINIDNNYQYPDIENIGLDTSICKIPLTTSELKEEVDKLRRTNISLLNALAEEKKSKENIEHKLSFSMDDKLEIKTQYEIEIESLKLEIRQLKIQLRSICDNHSLTDIFATFEDNVSRLVRENETLRQMNIQLETQSYHYVDSNINKQSKQSIQQSKKGLIKKASLTNEKNNILEFNNNNQDNTNFNELDWIASPESYKLQTLKKENLRLLTKIKKINNENDELKIEYEKFKCKERQFILNSKIANDTSNRLRNTYQELVKIKNELIIEKNLNKQYEKDLNMIQEDTILVRKSEAYLKEERNLILNEIAMLRERVREVDHESNRMFQLNKFINKHTKNDLSNNINNNVSHKLDTVKRSIAIPTSPNKETSSETKMNKTISLYEKIDPYRAHIANIIQKQRNKSITNQIASDKIQVNHSNEIKDNDNKENADIGIAGLSNAHYFRREEQDGINPALEVSLTTMHEALLATVPTLLPLFRKLSDDIHNERAISLKKRSDLLSLVYPKQYSKKDNDYQQIYSNIIKSNVKK